ncbi:MAG TPA: hypothetical protein VNO53_08490 [Steroidobacteraceae bacterium]|nr:hypothetical protein [Steroidobacteraceae bacterium]
MSVASRFSVAVLGALLAMPALAEEPAAAAFLGRLAGAWQGTGAVRQMAADMRMRWEPVLDGEFHRLSMENRMTGQDGQTWHFKADAYYRVRNDGTIAGTWFDSRGISLPLSGRVEGDAMTIDWGTPDIERGRSTYRLTADALEVTDEVYTKDGALAVFGRTRLTR